MKKTYNCLIFILSGFFLLSFQFITGPSVFAQKGKIAIFGSSVAKGSGDTTGNGGYTGIIADTLRKRGWQVVNVSKGGDNTVKIMPRFYSQLLPENADFVILGLSLGNEGINSSSETTRNRVFERYRSGMLQLIKLCRENKMYPVVANCYARNDFRLEHYQATKKMNLIINTWDSPGINLLGAVENGRGNWETGYAHDKSHPNIQGHRELYFAFVPSLFDAIAAGKQMPVKTAENHGALIAAKGTEKPLYYQAGIDSIHSFSFAFQVKPFTNGSLAGIRNGISQSAVFFSNGKLVYESSNSLKCEADTGSESKGWQYVLVTHRFVSHETFFFVNGKLAGSIKEYLKPDLFIVGGSGINTGLAPASANYKDILIYRSSLNQDEAQAIYYDQVLQSSLEIYSPLNDMEFTKGRAVINMAQSLSELVVGEGEIKGNPPQK